MGAKSTAICAHPSHQASSQYKPATQKDHAHICLGLDLKISRFQLAFFLAVFVFELIKLDACDLKSILFRTFCFVLLSEAYLVIALA